MAKNILLVKANSSDQNYLAKLNKEIDTIRNKLQPALGHVEELNPIGSGTFSNLYKRLNADKGGPINLLHFCGHSSEEEFQLENGETIKVGDFADFLCCQNNIEVVFLNSCHSQVLGKKLLQGKIKAVIETSQPVDDERAAKFAKWFYEALSASDSKSLYQAFESAVIRYNQKYGEKDQIEFEGPENAPRDRGSGRRKDDNDKVFAWSLSCKDKADVENWYLVPPRKLNLKLSSCKPEEYRFRIFCIYDRSQTEYFQAIEKELEAKGEKERVLVNGLWKVEDKEDNLLDPTVIVQDLAAANIVFLLNHGSGFSTFFNEEFEWLTSCYKQKNLILIDLDSGWSEERMNEDLNKSLVEITAKFPSSKFLPDINTLEAARSIINEKKHLIRMFVNLDLYPYLCSKLFVDSEGLKKELMELDFNDQTETFSKSKICGILDEQEDVQEAEEAMMQENVQEMGQEEPAQAKAEEGKAMPKEEPVQKQEEEETNLIRLCMVLLEGTSSCAQNLLIKRLTNYIKPKVTQPYQPPFDFNHKAIKLESIDDIWGNLSLLFANNRASSREVVYDRLSSFLNNHDLVLVFDNIGIKTDATTANREEAFKKNKKLLEDFWGELISFVKECSPKNRIFIFAINRTYSPQFNFSDIQLTCNDFAEGIRLKEISKLDYGIINKWQGDKKMKLEQKEFQLFVQNIETIFDFKNEVYYVQDGLKKICEFFNLPNLEVEILSLKC